VKLEVNGRRTPKGLADKLGGGGGEEGNGVVDAGDDSGDEGNGGMLQ
jgi:hypothetical protein